MPTSKQKIISILFNSDVNEDSVKRLIEFVINYVNKGYVKFDIFIDSHGGDTSQAIMCYQVLKALPISITTYNIKKTDSSALILYLCGTNRFTYPGATFLIHGSMVNFTHDKSWGEKDYIEQISSFKYDDDRIAKIISENTKSSYKNIKSLITKGRRIKAKYAIEKGIAQEIAKKSIPKGVKKI